VHIPDSAAARCLEALASRGLLDVRIASEVLYRFSPANNAVACDMEGLAEVYGQSRGPLVAFVTSQRRRSLKDFTDAFRITREDGDG
jgi:hypothetical protein